MCLLELAETCQTRRFELQTVPVLFMRAVDSGLFLEALFHRLTSVQISIVSSFHEDANVTLSILSQ